VCCDCLFLFDLLHLMLMLPLLPGMLLPMLLTCSWGLARSRRVPNLRAVEALLLKERASRWNVSLREASEAALGHRRLLDDVDRVLGVCLRYDLPAFRCRFMRLCKRQGTAERQVLLCKELLLNGIVVDSECQPVPQHAFQAVTKVAVPGQLTQFGQKFGHRLSCPTTPGVEPETQNQLWWCRIKMLLELLADLLVGALGRLLGRQQTRDQLVRISAASAQQHSSLLRLADVVRSEELLQALLVKGPWF
jgi:hypothetical protein